MCGICGVVGRADEPLIQRMMDRLVHRGPDDQGVYIGETAGGERVGLGHLRLSIIDLSSAGREPMPDAAEELWLTYNGEIYNFKELRAELEAKGHRFRSNTDAEVLLYAYREWGADCLRRLNGMFAFGIWDRRNESLFLARDRLGIKPLYWAQTPVGFAFASEIKALLAIPGFETEPDPEALDQFLTFLWVPDPGTAFRGVHKLPPGHHLTLRNGALTIAGYWDLVFDEDNTASEEEWIDKLRAQIGRSVRGQLASDVPLGAFLSGGLDSSTVVALMSGGAADPPVTFTCGFKPEDLRYDILEDDVKFARLVGRRFSTDYHEEFLEPDVVDLLPKLVYHMDEPIADPAIITSYLVCRAARSRLTVLLSGMGGDEVFAGYPRHAAVRVADVYNLIPEFISRPVVGALPGARPGRLTALFRNTKKLARSAALPQRERYLGFGTYFTQAEKGELYSPAFRDATRGFDPYSAHNAYFDRVSSQDFVNQMLYVDMKTYLPCLNLTYTDKTSMAASTEVRVPLLDHELVELAARVPARLKLKGLNGKYILKRAAEAWLPREVINRRKAGFSAPIRAWLARDLKGLVDEMLSEKRIRARGYFDPAYVRRMIQENASGREDNNLKLFQLLTLEYWHEVFFDRRL